MLTEEVLLNSYNPCCKEGWPAGKHNFLSCPATIRNDSRQEDNVLRSTTQPALEGQRLHIALKGFKGFSLLNELYYSHSVTRIKIMNNIRNILSYEISVVSLII